MLNNSFEFSEIHTLSFAKSLFVENLNWLESLLTSFNLPCLRLFVLEENLPRKSCFETTKFAWRTLYALHNFSNFEMNIEMPSNGTFLKNLFILQTKIPCQFQALVTLNGNQRPWIRLLVKKSWKEVWKSLLCKIEILYMIFNWNFMLHLNFLGLF